MSVTVRTFQVLPLAHEKMRCAKCHAKLREGEWADSLVDHTGFTFQQHHRACPSNVKPLPTGAWHIQGSRPRGKR